MRSEGNKTSNDFKEWFSSQPFFILNDDDLIIRINHEVFSFFDKMKKHPDKFSNDYFSMYPYRHYKNGNTLYAKNHFRISFAAGLSWMHIEANVMHDEGWWYADKEFYTLHDGRGYNIHSTFGDFLRILAMHNVDYKFNLKKCVGAFLKNFQTETCYETQS